jgi:hypothetical protein
MRRLSMQTTREIPLDQWQSFCEEFSRSHQGWLATLGTIASDVLLNNPQTAEDSVAIAVGEKLFQGITSETRGDKVEFFISLGQRPDHVTHHIREPQRMRLEQTPEGAHRGLQIDAANNQTIVLRFRTAVPLETLDGLSEAERL